MIEGWTGRVGSGKTYSLCQRCLHIKRRRKKVRIFTNVPLFDFADGTFSDWEEMFELDNAVVVIDEISVWMGSRDWGKLPLEVGDFLAQSRKDGVDLLYTAQAFAGVDTIVRRLTATVYHCERLGPLVIETARDPHSGENLGKRYHLLSKKVFRHYNTYQVASRPGQGQERIGRAQLDHYADHLVTLLDQGLIRDEDEFTAGYRRPTLLDLYRRLPDVVGPDHQPVDTTVADLAASYGQTEQLFARVLKKLQERQEESGEDRGTPPVGRSQTQKDSAGKGSTSTRSPNRRGETNADYHKPEPPASLRIA